MVIWLNSPELFALELEGLGAEWRMLAFSIGLKKDVLELQASQLNRLPFVLINWKILGSFTVPSYSRPTVPVFTQIGRAAAKTTVPRPAKT